MRLADAMLMFCAVSAIVYGVEEPDDLTRLVERFLIGCGVFVVILAFAAVALPRSMTWNVPEQYTVNQEVERFRGLLNNPNDVGVLMLATVGAALAFWNRFEPRKKKWLAAIALLSVSEAALADSRTPFIALGAPESFAMFCGAIACAESCCWPALACWRSPRCPSSDTASESIPDAAMSRR